LVALLSILPDPERKEEPMPRTSDCRLETNLIIKGKLYRPAWKEDEEWKADLTEKLEQVIKEALEDFIPEAEVEFEKWSRRP